MDTVLQDLKYAVRTLGRAPAFTAAAILAIALGAGGSSAMFSVLEAVVLRPIAAPEPDRLVRLHEASPAGDRGGPGRSRIFSIWPRRSATSAPKVSTACWSSFHARNGRSPTCASSCGPQALRKALYQVSATDPLTFAAVATLLLAIAALASWAPARRAARVDPMVSLRAE